MLGVLDMGKILVVDDSRFARLCLSKALVEVGYEVFEMDGAGEIVDFYESHRPDMVLMDIAMEGCDGLQSTEELLARFPEARVVVCSACAQQATVVQALKAGAVDFLPKPVDRDRLLRVVSSLLNQGR